MSRTITRLHHYERTYDVMYCKCTKLKFIFHVNGDLTHRKRVQVWLLSSHFARFFEILSFKDIRVTTLTFWGHVTSSVTWPLNSQYSVSYRWSIRTDRISCTVIEILRFNCIGVTTLTFRVTWRHRSRDHWIHKVWFPIGSQCEPAMSLTPLLRY